MPSMDKSDAQQVFRRYCRMEFNSNPVGATLQPFQVGPRGSFYTFISPDGCYEVTVFGDGVVRHKDRALHEIVEDDEIERVSYPDDDPEELGPEEGEEVPSDPNDWGPEVYEGRMR